MDMNSFADWQVDIDSWDKKLFISELSSYLYQFTNSYADKHSIALLAESIDIFIMCTKDIRLNGLVVTHSNGVTGKNHHVEIRDKSLGRCLQLMNELGLTPKTRKAPPPKKDPKIEALLRGPFGASRFKENQAI